MASFTLHCFPESGGCYKVALMLALCGADWQGVWVDYAHSATRQEGWKDANNVMGEVPVLEHAGLRLTQSGVILHYLAEQFGRFGAGNQEEAREILRWILFDNHKFTSYFATYRWLRSFTAKPDPAVLAAFRARADSAFAIVERHLQDRAFILGDRPSIADISMVGYQFFPAGETGTNLPETHPNIAAWLGRIRALPGWRAPYDLIPGPRIPRQA